MTSSSLRPQFLWMPLALLALAGAAQSAQAQESASAKLPRYGLDLSYARPLNARTRDTFGGSGLQISPGFRPVQLLRPRLRPALDYSKYEDNDNQAKLLGLGVRYLVPLGVDTKSGPAPVRDFAPYAGLALQAVRTSVRVPVDGVDEKSWKPALTASLGAGLGTHFFVETSYRYQPKVGGYDFSGVEFTVGGRF